MAAAGQAALTEQPLHHLAAPPPPEHDPDLTPLDPLRQLGQQGGPLDPPVRSVLFGAARFETHGHSLAASHEVVPAGSLGSPFFPRLQDNIRVLQRARSLLELHAHEGMHLGPAAHWLLDNAALLDEQLRAIRQGLPRNFFRLLPQLRDQPLAGLPRIYGVAWAWVAHTDSGMDLHLLQAYLGAYQQTRELTLAELWALPTTLRVVLVENLRRLAERSAVQELARDAAHRWIDQPDERRSLATLDRIEQGFMQRGAAEAFWLQLQQRDDEVPAAMSRALTLWLTQRLPDAAASLARQQAEATEDHQSIRNAITSLRALDRINWRRLFANTNAVMRTMAQAPVHAAEREDTQDATLHAIERLARLARLDESKVAQRLLDLTHQADSPDQPAAAPAHWWRGPGLPVLRRALGLAASPWPWDAPAGTWRSAATAAYLGSLSLLTLAGVAWLLHRQTAAATPTWLWLLAGVLLLGPVSEAVVAVVNRLISESAPPARLPRLAWLGGIPPQHRVIVVVPAMLTSTAGVATLCAQLQQHRIANPEAQAQFALLTDYVDADTEHAASDAALLASASAGITALNALHPPAPGQAPAFLLLHRQRQWSDSEQRWIGWERKRGKLEQLVRALSEPSGAGSPDRPDRPDKWPFIRNVGLALPAPGIRYIVTLDADTDMPPGRLHDLVGLAAHPLNQPVVDPATRRVVSGYGILQPRIETPLPAPATVTRYHRLFSGQCGIDPYSAANSELYQDVFGEGSFTGKGLLNVAAVYQTLVGRLPDNQVLSHDLLEGAIARCASVSDITLLEDAPVHADVAASRVHRWTRGDWQLLPFLLPLVLQPLLRPAQLRQAGPAGSAAAARLPLISRWKMLDNLRRSLVAPMSLALLLLVLASGVLPLAWALGVVAAAFSAGPLLGALAGLAPSRDDIALRLFYRQALADLGRALALALWHTAELLELALLYGDAISRALYRQLISRRRLLQWTTAAAAQAAVRYDLPSLLRRHAAAPAAAAVLAGLLGLAAWLGAPVQATAAAALLLLWAGAPLWVWFTSQPASQAAPAPLDTPSRDYLHHLARDTWRYFERHVTADDQHLPPDNVQFSPHTMVAHRTSPTNIGMYLLSATCAETLGFIGRAELAHRLSATLDTLDRLPRHAGHFYNWYDTQTLAVLQPAYVSTVDSGNCSGHLLAVAAACDALASSTAPAHAAQAALALSAQRLQGWRAVLASAPSLATLADLCSPGLQWPSDAAAVSALANKLARARVELDSLRLGATDLQAPSADEALPRLQDHLAMLDSALSDLQQPAAGVAARLHAVALRCRVMAVAPNYAMLFDPERKLLHIGYRVATQQLDDSHYDLLASESRLTSLLAIAKGDVPVLHWAALGRPFFACGTEVGLKSWSGSMFEYLMPALVLDEPEGSVLYQVNRSAVHAQIAEAQGHHTPWGLSESAIAGQDHTLAYQYGPQGVARLALRRTPADERVVAPYASVMALLVAPAEALANLHALQALGARRSMGFIEALDFTPQRQIAAEPAPGQGTPGRHRAAGFTPVHTFMAHHQAMSLVAITSVLTDGAPRRWAMADPLLRAVGALLQERAPREVPLLADPLPLPAARRTRAARLVLDSTPLAEALAATHLLTNGRHTVVLRSHGAGYSQWEDVGLTRWRDDLLRDELGSHFYLQRDGLDGWSSITARPAPDPQARYSCRLQADRAVFDAQWPDLHSRCTVWVSPEDDCELRQVELRNTGQQPITLTLASAAEMTLAPQRADEAHPAFSNLFVQARWQAEDNALHLRRQPRLPDEQALRAVHFLAGVDAPVLAVTACADRARWLGRYGSPAQPLGSGGLVVLDHAPAPGTGRAGETANTANTADTADIADIADTADYATTGVPVDTGLDPVASIAVRLRLAPGATVQLTFCTAASRQADVLAALVDKYRQASHVARASSMSHTMAGIRLRELQFDTDTWAAMLHLNTMLTSLVTRELPTPPRDGLANPAAAAGATADAPHCDRRLLWRHGLSGDRPIVLVTIHSELGLGLVLVLKKALRLWNAASVCVDLVVINAEPPSYLSPVQHQLQQLRERANQADHAGLPSSRRSSLHLLPQSGLDPSEEYTLQVLARVRLQADGRSLAQQIGRLIDAQARDGARRAAQQALAVMPVLNRPSGRGGRAVAEAPVFQFDPHNGALQFAVSPQRHPARPWVNLLANPDFGCQVSELGVGFTWAGNSRMHQLTGWSNDALRDPPSEWLLLQDQDTKRVWPLGRALQGAAQRTVEHAIGHSRMVQRIDGLDITLQWCVDATLAVRQLQVQVAQTGGRLRRLRLVALAEWTLGGQRSERLSLHTRAHAWAPPAAGAGLPAPAAALALEATQLDHLGGFGGATAWLAWRPAQAGDADSTAGQRSAAATSAQAPAPQTNALQDWTCDRREFHNTAGALVLPPQLGQASGSGLDACAAIGATRLLPIDGDLRLTLLLGHAASPAAARALLGQAWPTDPSRRLAGQHQQLDALLHDVTVQSPDPAFNALTNHWLPYQALACRLWARAGFYQAGGAYGFRDQLQDAMSLVNRAPQLLARQIRINAARQFPEGDVQHWWHAPGGAGVRTHFSDDLLWLPYACALYVQRTGDHRLLDESLPFLAGAAVPPGAEDLYETPQVSDSQASIYEHAARAIGHSLRSGSHGLPLFGTGDWNDGMNRVGHLGRGESVWLAWFLCAVVDNFLPIATARGDSARVAAWTAARQGWVQALDAAGWDGQWYRRGYFDDGSALGAAANPECRIDLIAQAWAVLSGAGQPPRARQAMASAKALLWDEHAQLLRLLDPPLQHASPSAGYIQAYPPGVRENGGQYNHAAVWGLMALSQLGDADGAWRTFTALSPAHRWADPARGATYALEPHVLAGDIYSQPPWAGRGGWSWYTGSAGWLARAAVESICGVVLAQGQLHITPGLPSHWPAVRINVRHGGRLHQVWVCADEAAARQVLADTPAARRAPPGQPIVLASLADGSVQVVVATAAAVASVLV